MSVTFALLILAIGLLPPARSQFVTSLPQCIQDCINQSGDENCSVTDIKCLCRASAGNFLPDVITCMHGNCDNNLDNDLLLTPLQLVCEIAGTPIPDSAIQNAENAGSSLVTKTVTTSGPSATSGGFEATTTVNVESSSVSTVTITTTQGGSVIAIAYPITQWQTTTASGSGSTITKDVTSTEISSSSETESSDPSVSSSSSDLTTIITTSLAAAQTSSSQTQTSASKTKDAPSEDSTNSSPFKNTNSANRRGWSNWLGLTIFFALGISWF